MKKRSNKCNDYLNITDAKISSRFNILLNPDIIIAKAFEKEKIKYAFIGTTKAKYIYGECRNMVQIAVSKEDYDKAKRIIQKLFKGIKITENPHDTIGDAMSVVYIKCFPVDDIKYNTISTGKYKIRISNKETENEAFNYANKEDLAYIPAV